jgi:hypothetical protein
MAMGKHKGSRSKQWCQPSLFGVPSVRPTWESLPDDVRQLVTELVVRLLREARDRRPVEGTQGAKEATDE